MQRTLPFSFRGQRFARGMLRWSLKKCGCHVDQTSPKPFCRSHFEAKAAETVRVAGSATFFTHSQDECAWFFVTLTRWWMPSDSFVLRSDRFCREREAHVPRDLKPPGSVRYYLGLPANHWLEWVESQRTSSFTKEVYTTQSGRCHSLREGLVASCIKLVFIRFIMGYCNPRVKSQ